MSNKMLCIFCDTPHDDAERYQSEQFQRKLYAPVRHSELNPEWYSWPDAQQRQHLASRRPII